MAKSMWMVLAVGGLGLVGCAGGKTAPEPSAGGTAAAASTLVPGTTPLSSARLSVNVARSLVYQSQDGKMAVVEQRDPPPDCVCAGRNWQVRRFEVEGDPSAAAEIVASLPSMRPARERTYVIVPGGSVALVSEINREEGVEVVFDPPLVVLPEGSPCVSVNSAEFAQDLTMKVHPIGNRGTVKRSGPVKNTFKYLGDERIQTPAGAFTARKVASSFTADLAPARVNNQSTQWFVDGVGLVREDETEVTTALGVPVRKNTSRWALFSFVPAPPTPATGK